MQLTVTDYNLAAAQAAHAHLVRLHTELTVALVLAWLRENRKHPKAQAIDSVITLYRLHGNLQDLRDADDYITTNAERILP